MPAAVTEPRSVGVRGLTCPQRLAGTESPTVADFHGVFAFEWVVKKKVRCPPCISLTQQSVVAPPGVLASYGSPLVLCLPSRQRTRP